MIYKNGQKVIDLFKNGSRVLAVYKNGEKVYTYNSGSRLPSAYQEVEYIEGLDNNSYINSGIVLQNKTDIEMTFMSTTVVSWAMFIQINNGVSSQQNIFYRSGTTQNCYVPSINPSAVQTFSQNNIYTFEAHFETNNAKWRLVGKNYISKNDYSVENFGYSTTIRFGRGQTRNYAFKIKIDNVAMRDYIPCYRKSDGVAGMYDAVYDVFYTNAGSGSGFITGGNV